MKKYVKKTEAANLKGQIEKSIIIPSITWNKTKDRMLNENNLKQRSWTVGKKTVW